MLKVVRTKYVITKVVITKVVRTKINAPIVSWLHLQKFHRIKI